MNEQELTEILAFGREQQGIEFKGHGTRKALLGKVIRAVLSMANKRDGGKVIIGISEDDIDGKPIPEGLSESELKTWNYSDFADSLSRYADPSVDFDLEVLEYQGIKIVVLDVAEFEDIPVLCKRDHQDGLREGACYVRSRRKPESVEIPSQAEMRDLLDLATIKALRKYISIARAAGIEFSNVTQETDSQKFDVQLGDLLNN